MKTYIINLKRSANRREHILKETARFPFLDVELVDAVDGRELSAQEEARLFDRQHFMDRYHGRIPSPGEIGCTLSHRRCYHKLLQSDEEYALILEDDVVFSFPEKMASYHEACRRLISDKADIVLSTSRCVLYRYRKLCINGFDFYPVYTAYTTHAYIISKKAAMTILRKDKHPSIVADDWRAIVGMGITVYAVSPEIISVSDTFNTTVCFKPEYIPVCKSRRYLKYRIYGWCSLLFCLLGSLLGFMQNMRKSIFKPSAFIGKANGL
ncbi:glycosyltransferase family 25 protein [Parabacteroides bouchesdurhonensis]|uniref:glycosyltransferase family 25 protein n=1 Tax=Parabacteroides bouchesdurhonensis TaxID=1936995 RepID=UPI000E50CAFE|nr:glycosyltransferase family 25 protein [Parabacteroides bouchesdurhonensis]RHJ94922.1 hypothetical protein DW095_00320 [Bacteroides sp. AM07-16]